MKRSIITGITGQDGCYLAQQLINKGYEVIGLVRDLNQINDSGLKHIGILDKIRLEQVDLLSESAIVDSLTKFKPTFFYNLAAQSSVSNSFIEPTQTLLFNISSVINILEAIRKTDINIKFYQASSSEMFGKVVHLPVSEQTVLHPLSPYAISKASAHWITVNYREAYGLFTCCGILFNHDSYLRPMNFFTKKVIRTAIEISKGRKEFLEVGNIDVKRDFGYAPKYVEAMILMMEKEIADDYLICSGESIYLRDIIEYVFSKLNISTQKIVVNKSLYRPAEIMDMYGANYKAKAVLGWKYDMTYFDVLDILIQEELHNW